MRRKTAGILLFLALFALFTACNRSGFDGNRTANPYSYRLDIERMNGTETHTMGLDAGDALEIRFETEHGNLHMEIKAPDGTIIYMGNGEEAADFTVNISEGGAYTVLVKAHGAKGAIYIQRVCAGATSAVLEETK